MNIESSNIFRYAKNYPDLFCTLHVCSGKCFVFGVVMFGFALVCEIPWPK